ncbi:uncharacterized protein EAE97_007954 [Botrytis byssoidea]|uniref:Uncharacterized protein n=1 Tax=Botrytis byssoidea TaxID=139641 RepID=A0A9P5IHV6_9HELO|nr:uncharacterized protein EAE97_007954 [Botrytis byssoidea]KAF7936588.1 hypothetical protein EAE97_007954 [Botrytis byssoidea]
MQAARHETISWEEMALELIDHHQQTNFSDIGLSPYPVMGGYLGTTGSEISFGFLNSAATIYPNVEFYNLSVPDFSIEEFVENGDSTGTNMNAVELNFFNELPSIEYTDIINPNRLTPNYPASMLGPAPYPPAFINPDSAFYLLAQVPVQQPVLQSRQQAPPTHYLPGCGRTYSRSDKVLEHRRKAGH